MSTIAFDTLKYAERLEKAGLTREQAGAMAEAQKEVFAEALESQLATKADIQAVRAEIGSLRTEVDGLRRDIKESELRMVTKLGAMMVIAVGVVAALVKLL